eukprot:TRINITY_DN12065_c0_g1_i1.p1 TRINITY_DN12065_c0_g1~~TRINITY_DN12065_c0_g1_i1.p1  ORF type:complete len:406 (+),score=144.89 TRINITY_DN12065_c0_g1_i1:110-1327(+)
MSSAAAPFSAEELGDALRRFEALLGPRGKVPPEKAVDAIAIFAGVAADLLRGGGKAERRRAWRSARARTHPDKISAHRLRCEVGAAAAAGLVERAAAAFRALDPCLELAAETATASNSIIMIHGAHKGRFGVIGVRGREHNTRGVPTGRYHVVLSETDDLPRKSVWTFNENFLRESECATWPPSTAELAQWEESEEEESDSSCGRGSQCSCDSDGEEEEYGDEEEGEEVEECDAGDEDAASSEEDSDDDDLDARRLRQRQQLLARVAGGLQKPQKRSRAAAAAAQAQAAQREAASAHRAESDDDETVSDDRPDPAPVSPRSLQKPAAAAADGAGRRGVSADSDDVVTVLFGGEDRGGSSSSDGRASVHRAESAEDESVSEEERPPPRAVAPPPKRRRRRRGAPGR